jgi:hypothetical protein
MHTNIVTKSNVIDNNEESNNYPLFIVLDRNLKKNLIWM